MTDIHLGIGLMILLSVAAFGLTLRGTRDRSKKLQDALALATIALFALYLTFLWDNIALARLLPIGNIVVVGNWLPLLTAILAAVAWRPTPGNVYRRGWPVVVLSGVGVYALIHPLLGTPPTCRNQWDSNNVCIQTSEKTCTAACAATVLRRVGIDATESEMAQLCLTREGTNWAGLYHGLKHKTRDTDWDVEIITCSAEDLRDLTPDAIILSVGIGDGEGVPPIYSQEWGWKPGFRHSVVLHDFVENERVSIADPSPGVGLEQWTEEDLRVLWLRQGMRLVRR